MIVTASANRSTLVATPIKAQPRLVIFRLDAAGAQPELQAPIRQEVDRSGLTRDQHGMAQIVIQDVGADPQVCRRLRGADQSRHRCDKVGQMIGHGQGGVAEILDLAGRLLPLGPRLRVPEIHAKSERLHAHVLV